MYRGWKEAANLAVKQAYSMAKGIVQEEAAHMTRYGSRYPMGFHSLQSVRE
jgi:hypothetical protein